MLSRFPAVTVFVHRLTVTLSGVDGRHGGTLRHDLAMWPCFTHAQQLMSCGRPVRGGPDQCVWLGFVDLLVGRTRLPILESSVLEG